MNLDPYFALYIKKKKSILYNTKAQMQKLKIGLYQNLKIVCCKGYHQERAYTTHRTGESICKSHILAMYPEYLKNS